ncbi:MAG TPA: RDD family protein [Xanthomonadales bacterium]
MDKNKPGSPTSYTPCPLPRRLMAMLYDTVILLGLLIVATALALPFGDVNKVALHDFWFTLWLLVVCFAYLGGCWRYGGMTMGMRAWRLKLVSADDRIISWPRCLLRFLVGLVALGAFGLGILWALVDSQNRGWHDLAAHTLLIKSVKN